MSIRLFTTPEASVPGMSQCSQPWVCEIIDTELPVPPTGKPSAVSFVDQRLDLVLGADHELDVAARGEADMAFGELVADVAELADGEDVHLPRRAGAHRPDFVAALGDVMKNAGTRAVVPGPVAVVLLHEGMHVRETDPERRTRWGGAVLQECSSLHSPRIVHLAIALRAT